jgi:hypothetical protein
VPIFHKLEFSTLSVTLRRPRKPLLVSDTARSDHTAHSTTASNGISVAAAAPNISRNESEMTENMLGCRSVLR